jgi:glycosyltransferase involved in cell wall biosynthesis
MRICLLTSAPLPPAEGIGFYVWNLASYLRRAGHSVQVITRGSSKMTFQELQTGIPVWKARFLPFYPLHVQLHSLPVNRLLHTLVPEIDLLHAHTPLVPVPGNTLPTLVTVHTWLKSDVGAIKTTGVYDLLVKLQAPFSYALENALLQASDRVVAVSTSVAGELHVSGVWPAPVNVLGNGVDTRTFQPGEFSLRYEEPYILAVGRLAPRKGWADLVQAAGLVVRQRPGIKFLIAGSGPLEGQLRRAIRSRRLSENVILLGHISDRACLAGLYRRAAVFVHPALYEGLPTVLLEAMACGCPVVATAVSGALDVIEDGVNGLLAQAADPARLAEAILACLDNPTFGRQLGVCARNTIDERYSWEVVGRNYLQAYTDLLRTRLN